MRKCSRSELFFIAWRARGHFNLMPSIRMYCESFSLQWTWLKCSSAIENSAKVDMAYNGACALLFALITRLLSENKRKTSKFEVAIIYPICLCLAMQILPVLVSLNNENFAILSNFFWWKPGCVWDFSFEKTIKRALDGKTYCAIIRRLIILSVDCKSLTSLVTKTSSTNHTSRLHFPSPEWTQKRCNFSPLFSFFSSPPLSRNNKKTVNTTPVHHVLTHKTLNVDCWCSLDDWKLIFIHDKFCWHHKEKLSWNIIEGNT